jgi:L-galactose dehydrogenase
MDHVVLGRTGLRVTVGSLGAGGHSRLGQAYGATFDDSVKVVRSAIDGGMNFIDTAASYGTEPIVGVAISGMRDEVVISTKAHVVKAGQSTQFDPSGFVTGAEFARGVDESLARLRTDYIDVLHLHGVIESQYEYCVNEIVPVLESLKAEGKIRATGISERFYLDPSHRLLELALVDDLFDVMMVGMNIINPSARHHVLPMAAAKDVGIQCIYAVRGKLATKEGQRAVVQQVIDSGEVDPADVDLEDPLGFLVDPEIADSVVEACYRFDRHSPGVHTVVTGTGSVDHLRDNIRSLEKPPLPDSAVERIEKVFGRVSSVSAQ